MLSWSLKQFLKWHARRVQWSMSHPREAQQEAWGRLRRALRGSDVALASGFDSVRSLEAFRTLPAADAESLQPTFQRVYELGRASGHVFGRSALLGFARTSGTLDQPKHIPLNRAYWSSVDRTLVRMVASHLYTTGEWSTLLSGKRVLLGSRPRCLTSPSGLPVGDISGLLPTRTWRSMRSLYAPNHCDLFIEDWAVRAERTLDQLQGRQVVSLSGLPTLVNDFVRRACVRHQVQHLDEVWPLLRQYVYGGMHLRRAQREQLLRTWFRPSAQLRFFETYFSTEAPLAFSFEPDEDGMALNSLENLYLFRPYEGDRTMRFAHEIGEGENYSLHVTTPGGLVNYRMGDRIEVLSSRPLRIRVVGREGEELSLTGERLTLQQVDLALEAAGLGVDVLGSLLPAVWVHEGELPHLCWGVPSLSDRHGIDPARLDAALSRINVLYAEALQYERVVGPSRVIFIPPSVFERCRDARLGIGQFKMKRLFQSRTDFAAAYGWRESRSAHAEDDSGEA